MRSFAGKTVPFSVKTPALEVNKSFNNHQWVWDSASCKEQPEKRPRILHITPISIRGIRSPNIDSLEGVESSLLLPVERRLLNLDGLIDDTNALFLSKDFLHFWVPNLLFKSCAAYDMPAVHLTISLHSNFNVSYTKAPWILMLFMAQATGCNMA